MSNPETVETINMKALSRMNWCLRVVVAIQCLGLGGRYLFSSYETESDIYGWLYFDREWSESLAQSIDNGGALMTVAAGVLLLINGLINSKLASDGFCCNLVRRLDQSAALWIAAWMLTIALAHVMRTAVYAELTLAEHAVRYLAPLALFFSSRALFRVEQKNSSWHFTATIAIALLVFSASATFAGHGYKAIECYGPFTDLILLSSLQWTNLEMSQATAEWLLVIIGALDIVAAILLILCRSRLAALYMVIWGFVTAASRMTAMGWDAWPESLIRIANGGVPIAILLYWTIARKQKAPSDTDHLKVSDEPDREHEQT